MLRILSLMVLLTACTGYRYTTDYPITQNLLLPPTGHTALIMQDGLGLGEFFVIGEESIPNYGVEPDFLAFRGGQLGAHRAVWLGYDTVAKFWHWQQSCDTCDYYASIIETANSSTKSIVNRERVLRKKYSDLNVDIYFSHHVIYLVHPDSIPPADRVMAIGVYDNKVSALLASAWFDWNEQLDSVWGDEFVVDRFMRAQPIGFLKQTGKSWKSHFSMQTGVLRRKNENARMSYRIVPKPEESYTVYGLFYGRQVKLYTVYYGMHDLTIGSTKNYANPYQVEYRIDEESRVSYMHIKDNLTGGLFENHVRIYYRPETDSLPIHWRWPNYFLARNKP